MHLAGLIEQPRVTDRPNRGWAGHGVAVAGLGHGEHASGHLHRQALAGHHCDRFVPPFAGTTFPSNSETRRWIAGSVSTASPARGGRGRCIGHGPWCPGRRGACARRSAHRSPSGRQELAVAWSTGCATPHCGPPSVEAIQVEPAQPSDPDPDVQQEPDDASSRLSDQRVPLQALRTSASSMPESTGTGFCSTVGAAMPAIGLALSSSSATSQPQNRNRPRCRTLTSPP
jgi:hypothetical protein